MAETVLFLCSQVLDPYHLARFRAFQRVWPDMEVLLLPAQGEGRPWRAEEAPDLPIHRTFAAGPLAGATYHAAMVNVLAHLSQVRPAAVVATGYGQAMRRCVRRASANGAVTILHLATTRADKPRRFWREWPKRWVLKSFDAVAAVGERSARYAESLGVAPDRIWRVGNVVDNEHFRAGAAAAREEAPRLRRELDLPERFFLCVSRLAPEKNLSMFLRSFASYRQAGGTWHLVVVGSGPEEAKLRELTERSAPGAVHLPGWKPCAELPAYYGLACCFVLPSLSEPWGLVVNEAMASGLPVLVSRSCGCLPELCRPGVNGYDFDARRPEELVRLLTRVSSGTVNLVAMGEASRSIIAGFTPETWARNLADCVVATLERARGRAEGAEALRASAHSLAGSARAAPEAEAGHRFALPAVAHIIPYLAARYGGPPAVALGMGRAHRRLGGRVSWWATTNESERRELGCLEPEVRLFLRTFPQSWYHAPGLAPQLRAEGADFDLFHLHQFWDYPVYAGVRVACRLGKPIVLTPHGVFSHAWGAKALKKHTYLATIGRYVWSRCACLHAMAAPELRAFREAGYDGPAAVVPSGVEVQQFDRLAEAGKADALWPRLRGRQVACFLGRIHPVKGLERLLRAWRRVVRSRTEGILVLAGPADGREARRLRDLAEAMLLTESILFTGMVTEEPKLALLARADLLVLPSERESFPRVVLEALACGTPVVTTTGTPWSVLADVGAGYWVEPQAEALAAAISRILELPESDRRAMGQRGRLLVLDRYTWDMVARQMLTVYRCILEGREVPLYPEPAPEGAGRDLAGAEGYGHGGKGCSFSA